MGRPLHKRNFGAKAGDQIKVRAFPVGGAEGDGIIVRQKGTKIYDVTVGGVTGRCKLVDKANASLAAGEMTITVVDDVATPNLRVMKLLSKIAILNTGARMAWTFLTSTSDGKVDVPESADIAFSVQPAAQSGKAGIAASFSVTAASVPVEALTYQWQMQVGGAGAWANVANGGTFTNATTATLNIANGTTAGLGNQFRCAVSSATGGTVFSNAALLS